MLLTEYLKNEITLDKALLKRIKRFRLVWSNRNENRINFLTSPHIGVEPIRMMKSEVEDLFEITFRLDRLTTSKKFHSLEDINAEWKVGGEVYYLALIGIMSLIRDDSRLSLNDKDDAIEDLYFITSFSFLTSFTLGHFEYNLDINIAETVYQRLPRRFLIKKFGNWSSLLKHRANAFKRGGLYHDRLSKANNEMIVKLVAAIRTSLAGHYNEQYNVIKIVLENEEKRKSVSLIKEGEDGEYVAEVGNINRDYFIYAKAMVPVKREFISTEYVGIIADIFKRVDRGLLLSTLEAISTNYLKIKDMDKIVENIMSANIDYIYSDKKLYPPYDKRILQVVKFCRGLWSSSRVKDKNVLMVKKELGKIIIDITKDDTERVVIPLTMSIVMYIFVKVIIGYKK